MTVSDEVLRLLADDAREVYLWAMKLGLKKDRQIEEIAKALKKRLAEA